MKSALTHPLTGRESRICSSSLQELLNLLQELFRISERDDGINADRKLGSTLAFFQHDDGKSWANLFERCRNGDFLSANRFGIQNCQCNILCDTDCNPFLPSSCSQDSPL